MAFDRDGGRRCSSSCGSRYLLADRRRAKAGCDDHYTAEPAQTGRAGDTGDASSAYRAATETRYRPAADKPGAAT